MAAPPTTTDPRFGFDPVAAFLRRPLHEIVGSHVTVPAPATPDPLPHRSISGLHHLAKQYAWAAVLDLATSLLAEYDDHDLDTHAASDRAFLPHERLLCIAYRALALLQTRQLASADNALSQLAPLTNTNKKYRYESYPALYPPSRFPPASFIPFELKLLAVEIRIRHGDATAIADCYHIKNDVTRQITAETDKQILKDLRLQHAILLSSLTSYHLIAQQHDAATDVARQLTVDQGRTAAALYMYMRVLLQVGDFEAAARTLHQAAILPASTPSLQHLHSGMLLAARGRFQEALLEYDTALTEEKEEQPLSPSNVWVHATNNAAICLMHCGRLSEAVDRLEGALRRDPHMALDEGLIFNLAIMYDLAYPQNSTEKKKVLRDLASRLGRQGFDLEKIPIKEKLRR